MGPALVASACNPSYSGGRNQEDRVSKPAGANSSQDPILKKPIRQKGWWSGSRCRPSTAKNKQTNKRTVGHFHPKRQPVTVTDFLHLPRSDAWIWEGRCVCVLGVGRMTYPCAARCYPRREGEQVYRELCENPGYRGLNPPPGNPASWREGACSTYHD
jgi:hypothetical protein